MRNDHLKRALTGGRGRLKLLRPAQGSQLVEFALAMPFLVVLAIGVMDFGQAYNTKHIMSNAAREGARIVASNPLTDYSCTTSPPPCSIQSAADSVGTYMNNAGLTAAACLTSASPTVSGVTYSYSCNNVSLVINRGLDVGGGPGGSVIPSVQVTLSYPYTWTFGKIIGLLPGGGSGPTGTQTITTVSVMQILVSG